MGFDLKWTSYENPPKAIIDSVGKVFKHKEYGFKVTVLSFGIMVDYLPCNIISLNDIPLLNSPLINIRVLSGDFEGKEFSFVAGVFFERFTISE